MKMSLIFPMDKNQIHLHIHLDDLSNRTNLSIKISIYLHHCLYYVHERLEYHHDPSVLVLLHQFHHSIRRELFCIDINRLTSSSFISLLLNASSASCNNCSTFKIVTLFSK